MATTVWLDGEGGEALPIEGSPGPAGGVRLELAWRDAGFLRILLVEMDPADAARLVAEVGRELERVMQGGS